MPANAALALSRTELPLARLVVICEMAIVRHLRANFQHDFLAQRGADGLRHESLVAHEDDEQAQQEAPESQQRVGETHAVPVPDHGIVHSRPLLALRRRVDEPLANCLHNSNRIEGSSIPPTVDSESERAPRNILTLRLQVDLCVEIVALLDCACVQVADALHYPR